MYFLGIGMIIASHQTHNHNLHTTYMTIMEEMYRNVFEEVIIFPSIIETGMHQDLKDERFVSSVLFLDTCDGYLKLKNNDLINSEDNKLVTFKSNILHTGSTTTNAKRRIVLSIIYLPTL